MYMVMHCRRANDFCTEQVPAMGTPTMNEQAPRCVRPW